MDLTQWTHGRLLAALSFNNRYPSPSGASPSIISVSWVCGFLCLFVCLGPFHLTSSICLLSPPLTLSRTPSIFPQHICRHPYLIFSGFSCFGSFFSSPLPAEHSHPYLISSSSALPPPPLLFISPPLHLLVHSTAKKMPVKLSVCCQRDSDPRRSDPLIHAVFPAIQIKRAKYIVLCQLYSECVSKTHSQWAQASCLTLQVKCSFSNIAAGVRVESSFIRDVATSWVSFRGVLIQEVLYKYCATPSRYCHNMIWVTTQYEWA